MKNIILILATLYLLILSNSCGTNNKDLFSILNQHFGSCMNKARLKLISMFIQSLVKVQTVNFNRLENSFEANAKSDSSLRRIQRFFADYFYDIDVVAKLIFVLIPKNQKYGLSLDRTNWKIGETNINILVLGVG